MTGAAVRQDVPMVSEETPTRLGLVSSLRASSTGLGNWNLMVGMGLIVAGFLVFTRWK